MIGVLLGGGQHARTCRTHAFWPQVPTPRQFFLPREKSAKAETPVVKNLRKDVTIVADINVAKFPTTSISTVSLLNRTPVTNYRMLLTEKVHFIMIKF
jgi:hypothetical protein